MDSDELMLVLHANWTRRSLCIWAESLERWTQSEQSLAVVEGQPDRTHPFALGSDALVERLRSLVPEAQGEPCTIELALPAYAKSPLPSTRLAHAKGHLADEYPGDEVQLERFQVAAVAFENLTIDRVLKALSQRELGQDHIGPAVQYFESVVRFAKHLLVQQRFVPSLAKEGISGLTGLWQPWMSDEHTADDVTQIIAAMPPSARAAIDGLRHDPWQIIQEVITSVVDSSARRALVDEELIETIEGRDPDSDTHVAWLGGLLGLESALPFVDQRGLDTARSVRRWLGGLEERGANSAWRLCIRVIEPVVAGIDHAKIDTHPWLLRFHLQAMDDPQVFIDSEDVWALASESTTVEGYRLDSPTELLLTELARASRVYKTLEKSLNEAEPTGLSLDLAKAYTFLREYRPVLLEQGFGIIAPSWWDAPASRLGARLIVQSPSAEEDEGSSSSGGGISSTSALGLDALVSYQWRFAVGQTSLTLEQFQELADRRQPLVFIDGQWVEIRPEDLKAAVGFVQDNPGGQMRAGEAMRLAFASDEKQTGLPIVGLEASGWIADLIETASGNQKLPDIFPPDTFHGKLRPYQQRGLSWLSFLERFGLGACLADDMGLGKTIQLLALLAHERSHGESVVVLPTLLIVPTSVVGNWVHETQRFCPSLKLMVHHGLDRLQDERFVKATQEVDLVVTTYSLANRDQELLGSVQWGRIVLDEAQYVKNPSSKQSQAVRAIKAPRRVALTGTPVENRLSELWSIMDFLNPGHLGSAGDFRRRFSVPIERYHDTGRQGKLRNLVQPFVLRRLKTDPKVIQDLPAKVESREYCHLTSEQADLYEAHVKRMLSAVDRSEGMKRRGLVLATLIKLKQICNHPSQLLHDHDPASTSPPDVARSGKCVRIMEMLDEVVTAGDAALIFTQFRQMGNLLSLMLRHELDREVLFLHGGTPQRQRQRLVDSFQKADGTHPVMIVSLKAGGVGLNLTAANHVFHFDRWWNPAVENQATDRAYRIGQTRTVQVHKFVVRGTLEERIDEMLEEKAKLAEQIIGAGEHWLTELDTDQLRSMLMLHSDAVGD